MGSRNTHSFFAKADFNEMSLFIFKERREAALDHLSIHPHGKHTAVDTQRIIYPDFIAGSAEDTLYNKYTPFCRYARIYPQTIIIRLDP